MRKNHRSGGRDIDGDYIEGDYRECLYDDILHLPSVTPQPKMGKWIRVDKDKLKCSKCEVIHLIAQYPNGKIDWCPNCGSYNGGR